MPRSIHQHHRVSRISIPPVRIARPTLFRLLWSARARSADRVVAERRRPCAPECRHPSRHRDTFLLLGKIWPTAVKYIASYKPLALFYTAYCNKLRRNSPPDSLRCNQCIFSSKYCTRREYSGKNYICFTMFLVKLDHIEITLFFVPLSECGREGRLVSPPAIKY